MGSGRSGRGAHEAWLERGVALRSDLPLAARSAGGTCSAAAARAAGPDARRAGLRLAVAMAAREPSPIPTASATAAQLTEGARDLHPLRIIGFA
jgi:hypothetical protein